MTTLINTLAEFFNSDAGHVTGLVCACVGFLVAFLIIRYGD